MHEDSWATLRCFFRACVFVLERILRCGSRGEDTLPLMIYLQSYTPLSTVASCSLLRGELDLRLSVRGASCNAVDVSFYRYARLTLVAARCRFNPFSAGSWSELAKIAAHLQG